MSLCNCIGQAYDGASNKSGRHTETAACISKENPLASYTHCRSHVLNLSLMKSCKSIQFKVRDYKLVYSFYTL